MIIQAEFGTCEYIRVPDFVSIKFQIYPMFIPTFFFFFFTTAINLREAGRKVWLSNTSEVFHLKNVFKFTANNIFYGPEFEHM